MRVTITHPTINRRKTFTRAQRDDALRHLAVGWNITDPDEQDLDRAFDIAEGAVAVFFDGSKEGGFDGPRNSLKPRGSISYLVGSQKANIAAVLDWVDEDPHRAESALAAEQSAPNPRSTLITQLESIAAGDTDNAPEGEEE